MKRLHKTLIGAGFAFILSLFGLSACKDYQYIQKIPKKYLLDGNYDGSDDDFDFYKITTDEYKDQYAVSLKDGVTDRNITIPEQYNGIDVVGIYRNGFSDLENLSIVIPSSIQVIDYEAFMGTEFTNTSFSIPNTVEKLGTASFFGTNIQSLVFSDGESQVEGVCQATKTESQETETTSSKITEIPDFCFANCKDLASVTFSNSLETICTEAFENCSSLKLVAFLSGLEEIQDKAFNNCSSLTSVYIPSSIVNTTKTLGDFVFAHCNASLKYYIHIEKTDYNKFIAKYPYFLRQSEYKVGDKYTNYQWSQITGDVYANGSWLYNVQTLNGETNETINLMKFIGNFPSDGTMAFPDKITDKKVTTFSYDCVLAYESKIKRMYLPKYLEEVPDKFLRVDDSNKNYYAKLTYIGSMSGNNCYEENKETNVIDLSGLSDLHTIGKLSFKLNNDKHRDQFKKIALPENLVEVGEQAFESYNQVSKFIFSDEKRTISNGLKIKKKAFYALGNEIENVQNSIILPKDTTSIEDSAFENAYCIKELTIHGDSKTDLTIGQKAFQNCLYLEKVTIEERGKVTLNTQCFANWTNRGDYLYLPGLQFVYLPVNTFLSGEALFDRQNRLTIYSGDPNLTIANPSSTLGKCFDDEVSTKNDNSDTLRHQGKFTYFGFLCVPNVYKNVKLTMPSAGDSASQLYQEEKFTYLLKNDNSAILTKYHFDMRDQSDKTGIELNIPSKITANDKEYTVKEIGDNAFANDDSYTNNFTDNKTPGNSENTYRTISKITLPNSIEKIGDYAFFRCVGLHEINMPTSLKSIGTHAFSFSGIKQLTDLNDDCSLAGKDDTSLPSPFLDCPNLSGITLRTTGNTATLKVDDKICLKDANGNIIVVYPAYKPTDDTSFTFSSNSTKFYLEAFRGVSWIKNLTISSSNFPSGDKGQALFTGFNSEEEIREKCCYKGRIAADGSTSTNNATLTELNLKLGNDNTLSIPEGALLQTTISTVILPYGGGNRRIPSYLLNNIQTPENGLVIKVQKKSADSNEYTNSNGESGFLDLTDCGYTTIDNYAFYGLKSLRKVNLDGITTINKSAFQGTGLTEVNFPSSLTTIGDSAFQDSNNLQRISFPKNSLLNKIGSSAFDSCALTGELKLPMNLSTMSDSAFCNNPNIQKVNFSGNEKLKTIPSKAFEKSRSLTEIIFPTNLQTISDLAFHESQLQNVTIPETVTSIGNYAFQSCQNMTSLDFEGSNKNLTLGQYAFSGCSSLQSLILNRSMEVGSSCFTGCNSLRELTIANDPSKEISIKDNAFSGFIHLSSVTFGSSLKEIGTSAFQGAGITEADLSKCSKLTSVKGFDNCKNLTKVILPVSCTEIGDRCFSNCSSLKTIESGDDKTEGKVVLSKIVNRIGNNAFEGCSLITSIRCNTTGLTIGASAFKNCTGLTQFVQLNGTLTYSSQVIFEGCSNLKFIVLPDQFDMNSSGPLVTGLTQFSNNAYICINRAYQSFPSSLPAWAMINDTNNAKVAFASFDATRPDKTYLFTISGDTITVTGKNS